MWKNLSFIAPLLLLGACTQSGRFQRVIDTSYFEFTTSTEGLVRTDNQIMFIVDDSASMGEQMGPLAGALPNLVSQLRDPQGREAAEATLHMLKMSEHQPVGSASINSVSSLGTPKIYTGLPGTAQITNFLNGLTTTGIDTEPGIAIAMKAIENMYKPEIRALLAQIQATSSDPLPEALLAILEGRETLRTSLAKLQNDPDLNQYLWLANHATDVDSIRNLAIVVLSDEDNSTTASNGARNILLTENKELQGYTYKFRRITHRKKKVLAKEVLLLQDNPNNIGFENLNQVYTCRDPLHEQVFHYGNGNYQAHGYSQCRRPNSYTCQTRTDGALNPPAPISNKTISVLKASYENCVADPSSGTRLEAIIKDAINYPGVSECSPIACERNFFYRYNKLLKNSAGLYYPEDASTMSTTVGFVPTARNTANELGTLELSDVLVDLPENVSVVEYNNTQDHTYVWQESLTHTEALARFREIYPDESRGAHVRLSGPTAIWALEAEESTPATNPGFLSRLQTFYPELNVKFHSFVSKVDGKCSNSDAYPNVKGVQYMALSDATGGLKEDICTLNFTRFIRSLSESVLLSDQLNTKLPYAVDKRKGILTVKVGNRFLREGYDYSVLNNLFLTFEEGAVGPGESIFVSYDPIPY